MKQLFLVLLVINVLFFMWWQFDDSNETEVNQSQIVNDGSRSLVLLSEADEKNNIASESTESVKTTPEVVVSEVEEVVIYDVEMPASEVVLQSDNKSLLAEKSVCYTIGFVADQNKAKEVMSELMQLGIKVNQRITQMPVLIGYRVYIPPLASVEEAREMLQKLKRQGIKDSVIIRQGEYENGISLGVFSKKDGAKRHQDAMAKKGFSAKMVERYRDGEQYWFDTYSADKVDSLLGEWARISDKYPEIKKQPLNCK